MSSSKSWETKSKIPADGDWCKSDSRQEICVLIHPFLRRRDSPGQLPFPVVT